MKSSAHQYIRTPLSFDISEMLEDIKYLYRGLSESELIKLSISKLWTREVPRDKNGFTPRQKQELQQAIEDPEAYGPFEGKEAIDFLDSIVK